ncbi:hypothetical protein B9N43_01630 [Denitratisoma sp. DHT3]|uniref:class I SAM-dependent methyltransferase n=1 Tax=Denitratisoma sp. DHT3 TaxID=1981880 RepID=UPI00119839F4|nr:class I SAM-dependent methyltransferase [Denitratisoma sp. DHT3]QDX80067.1 hypothetical protein B9N43_01630 [Denitratisoma sp. DHT3]
MLAGQELFWDKSLSLSERLYCHLLGIPIVGLRIRLRRIKKLLPQTAANILDAGCGRGIFARFLAAKFPMANVTGVDSDTALQERNRNIARAIDIESRCDFVVADLTRYQPGRKFDLILSVDNLEHIEDDIEVIHKLASMLAEGGTMIVHVPHYYRRWPVFRWTENFDVPGHVRPGYHLAEIRSRIEDTGLTIQAAGYSYGLLENLSNNISYAVTGAEERNKYLYALLFPLLNLIAWFGQWSRPDFGAGIWIRAYQGTQQGTTALMEDDVESKLT